MQNNNEVLLSVKNLEQFFNLGAGKHLKAVNNVSFDIFKGEVFSLVGESGCGKTTTGRSIIRLYNVTGGSVYFCGQRICAGIRPYRQIVSDAKKAYNENCARFTKEANAEIKSAADDSSKVEIQEKYKALKDAENKKLLAIVNEQTKNIREAKHDQNSCNLVYAQNQMQLVKEKYEPLIQAAAGESLVQLQKEYKNELRLAQKSRIMNKMQMIFQDPIASLNPRMTVREIIAEGLIIRGIKDKDLILKQVHRVLDLVGLVPEHASRYPHEFSGGQRQRIGIARAIILNPELIIADEPISALDVSIQAQVINLLNDLRKELGLTILFIAHDLSVVKYFSDRIAVMYFGKIVEIASSDELFKNPLHPYTKSLLSAIPLPDPINEKKRIRKIYNPIAEHDYSTEEPMMHEVVSGHFVYCNSAELEKLRQEIEERNNSAKVEKKNNSSKIESDLLKTEKAKKTAKAKRAEKLDDGEMTNELVKTGKAKKPVPKKKTTT